VKKILIPALIIFLSLTSIALAKKPVKIARLPIIIQNNRLDYDTAAILEMKMARAVKVPMNNTLKTYEYLSPSESQKILGKIWQEMYTKNKKSQISDAIKIFADETDADQKNKGLEEATSNVYGNGHTSLYADVMDAIKNNRKPYVDAVAGRNALEMILSIYKSMKTGQPVKLPLENFASVDMIGEFNNG
jgi:predicted dehydrogenase